MSSAALILTLLIRATGFALVVWGQNWPTACGLLLLTVSVQWSAR